MADDDSVCSEETLRDAWNRLGVGKDGYLNQTELVLVCESIGLHRLARGAIRRLSDKLHLDFERGISFQVDTVTDRLITGSKVVSCCLQLDCGKVVDLSHFTANIYIIRI